MENNKKNDWVATMLSSPEAVTVDFLENGITPENTVMASKDEYKNLPKIKELFTNPKTEKFDETKFNTFYDHAVYGYNELVNKSEKNNILDNVKYYDNQIGISDNVKKYKSGVSLQREINPFKNRIGISEYNKVDKGKFSVRELAQQNEARDYKTGESLGYKPNDSSFTALFKEPLAVATWDEDGTHKDSFTGKEVNHYKGEEKFDDNGNFFYENLNGRDSNGKQILNLTDTITEDGSYANNYDFFDSDSLDKSISGTILKTAFSIAPYFIPGVRGIYTLYNTGVDLIDAIPSLGKAIGGLTGEDVDNMSFLNSIQNQTRKFKSQDVSDYAKNNTFGFENIAGIVSSSFNQLNSQKLIASIPSKLGASKKQVTALHKAVESIIGKKQADAFKLASYDEQLGLLNQLKDKSSEIKSFMTNLEFWNKNGARSISSVYMALTSATQTLDDAKNAGLDDKDAAMYYMGNVVGLYGLMNYTDIGHWALKGLGLDDINQSVNKIVKERSKEALKPFLTISNSTKALGEQTKQETSKGLRLLNIFNSAKTNASNIAKKVLKVDMTVNPYLFAALGEGTEEVSEEMLADGLKLVYNGFNEMGFTSTEKDKQFNFSAADIGSRYGMSFLGGGIGGMVFHANNNLMSKATKESNKDLLYLVRNGYGDKIKKKINDLKEKSVFGSRTLTPQIYSAENFSLEEEAYVPALKKEDSQNDIIANMLINEIDYIQNILEQNDIPEDKYLNEIYTKRIDNIIDLGLNSALLDDANILSSQIIEDQTNINAIPRPADTASNEEKSKYEQAVRKKTAILDSHRMELQSIINGESLPKYFKEAYFSTHGNINKNFGIKDINDFSKAKFNKYYSELNDEEKIEIDEDYDIYQDESLTNKREKLKIGLLRFEQIEKEVLNLKEKLARIEEEKVAEYNDLVNDDNYIKEMLDESQSNSFYMDRFDPVFDEKRTKAYSNLKIRQLSAKNQDINFSDYSFKADKDKLINAVDKEYDNLGFENINNVLFKNIILTNKLKETVGVGNKKTINDLLINVPISNFIINRENLINEFNNIKEKFENEKSLASNEEKINEINLKEKEIKDIINKQIQEFTEEDINKLKEIGFTENIINEYNNILNQKDKIVNYIDLVKKETNENLKVTPFFDLLREASISTGEKNATKALDLLQKYKDKLDSPNVDLSKFIISNKIEYDQLEKIQELITQVAIVTDSLTENNDKIKGIRKDTLFGSASNFILKRNGFESPYEGKLLSEKERLRMISEANRIYYQIDFMKELSKYNQGDKVGYDKSISIAYRLQSISSILPKGINSLFKIFDFISEEDLLNSDINESINYLTIKSNILLNKILDSTSSTDVSKDIDLSDEEFAEFEKHILQYEKFIYNKFQDLSIDDKKTFVDNLFLNKISRKQEKELEFINEEIRETSDPIKLKELNKKLDIIKSEIKLKIKEDLDSKQDIAPTKFNSTLDNYNYIDINSYILETISNPPQGFYVMLKGDTDSEGKSDFSKTPYAPLQIQETLLRKTFTLVSASNNNFNPIEYFYSKFTENYFNDEIINNSFSNTFETGIKIVGQSGTGKTASISTLARIFENDNKNILLYSPIKKVSDNLRNIVGERANVLNGKEKDSRVISDLSKSILGEDLYNRALNEIKTETILSTSNPNSKENEKALVLRIEKDGNYIYKLNINNKEIKEALNKINSLNLYNDISAIIIDEFTHLNPIDLDLLEISIRNHNLDLKEDQNKVSIVFIGDDSQEGFLAPVNGELGPITNITCHIAPKMTDMIRAGYNVKIDNISNLLSLQNLIVQSLSNNQKDYKNIQQIINNNNIVLGYTNDESLGVIGEKIVNEISIDDLTNIISKVDGTIGVIVSDVNGDLSTKIANLPEVLKSKVQIVQQNNVQGSEYDFTFIDIDPYLYDMKDPWSANNSIKQLYTLISRSKQGSLLKSSSISSNLNIKSSDLGIDDSKAKFEEDSINSYKEFREDILNKVIENEIYTKPKKSTIINPIISLDNNIPTIIADESIREWNSEDLIRAFELTSIESSSKINEVNKKIVNKDGISPNIIEFNKDKLFMYTFHERNSVYDGVSDSIILDNNALLLNDKYKKENIDSYKEDVDIIKKSILAKLSFQESKDLSISDLADNFKYGVLDKYNIDFSEFDLVIESRLTNPNYTNDISYAKYNKVKPDDKYKVINFINARFKSNDGKDVYITLAALPNLNNSNVEKYEQVKDRLLSLEKDFYDYSKKVNSNPEDAILIRKIKINEVKELNGISFIKHKDKTDNLSLDEFRSKNENKIKISEPYIISNFNIIGNDFPNKRDFSGRTFVVVSNNPTINNTELLDRYQSQIKDINNKLKNGETEIEIDKDTSIMFLQNKKIKFTNWIQKVHLNVEKLISGVKTSSDFKTLENESQSANLLTNMVNNMQWLNWVLSVPRNKRKDFQNKIIDNILSNYYDGKIKESQLVVVVEDIYQRIFNVLNLNKSLDSDFFKSLNSNKELSLNDKLNKINDTLVSKINIDTNSKENFLGSDKIVPSGIFKLLELSFEKENPIYRLFSSYDNIKKYKFTAILEAMVFGRNYQGSTSKEKTKSTNVGTDFESNFSLYNLLVSENIFDDSEKEIDNLIYINSVSSKKTIDSNKNVFAIKTVNDESDFIVTSEIIPSNIYMNIEDIEIEPIEESDIKLYKEKTEKKNIFKEIKDLSKLGININKYDYSLSNEEIIQQINNDLKNKIFYDNGLNFNYSLNENLELSSEIVDDIIKSESQFISNTFNDIDIDIDEINQIITYKYLKDGTIGAIYNINLKDKTFKKTIIDNPNIVKNSEILNTFVTQFKLDNSIIELLNEIDKTKNQNNYISKIKEITDLFNLNLNFEYNNDTLSIINNLTGIKEEEYIGNIEFKNAFDTINSLPLENELKENVNNLVLRLLENTVIDSLNEIDNFINSDVLISQIINLNESDQKIFIDNLEKIFEITKC